MPRIATNGIELDWDECGPRDGRPLVLIRGLGTQRTAWPDALLEAFAERGFRTLTFDNRDVGLSTKLAAAGVPDVAEALASVARGERPKAPYTLDDMALDVVGLLDGLGLERAHVVGISLGGMIAQLLAIRHGHRLRSMTSIMSSSGAPGLPAATPEAQRALLAEPENPADRESVIRLQLWVQQVIGSPGFRPGEAYLRRMAGLAYDRSYYPPGVARQLVAVLASPARFEALASIRVPTLVIHGESDPLVPVEAGRDTARRIPGAQLLLIPGMGHDVVPGLVPLLVPAIARHAERAEAAG